MKSYLHKYISTNTTTTVCSTGCVVHSLILGETAAGAITVKDGDTTVAVLKASIGEGVYEMNIAISNSLVVETAGASKVTVTYSLQGS